MSFDVFQALGLSRARLSDFGLVNEEERQPKNTPHVFRLESPERQSFLDSPAGTLSDWRHQEPVERLVNTILLCAIRDGASFVVVEPQDNGVQVRFGLEDEIETVGAVIEREHIRLPFLTLQPIVHRVKMLALGQRDSQALKDNEFIGSFEVQVDEKNYLLQVSTRPTEWGSRLEVRFSTDQSKKRP